MVEDTSATAQEALIEAIRPTRRFSVTRVIGGRLRALYDDTAQPCPDRVANLLIALRLGNFVSH
jgi:hypothetical protein